MPHRRIMSIWFPHIGAERVLRKQPGIILQPLAVIEDAGQMLRLHSLSSLAQEKGLRVGQNLSDARAMCPDIVTVLRNPNAEDVFMSRLQRWAGQFSPWVAQQGENGLCLDVSGCAHLFGGEKAMIARINEQSMALRLTALCGIADTVGAAWALARFSSEAQDTGRSGDAIDQEAYATRSRAFKRRNWERGGSAPSIKLETAMANRIACPGESATAISALPVSALRLNKGTSVALARVGLKRVRDLLELPRSALARRFGSDVLMRLDQATGAAPEPVSPSRPRPHFATRLSFPDPIGLPEDIEAGIRRLLEPLCTKLTAEEMGCRKVQLTCTRSDGTYQVIEAGLARASNKIDRIFPLLTLQIPRIEPGLGIDMMRLHSVVTERLDPFLNTKSNDGFASSKPREPANTAEADLIGRLGARIGLDAITQLHPADSTIPEKTQTSRVCAYSDAPQGWHIPHLPRPLILFPAEPLQIKTANDPLSFFIWRRRVFNAEQSIGPERISAEWWLDDPNWRSGTRDYWCVTTKQGPRLWLFKTQPDTWSCQGLFG